ncbi:cadherin-related family member 1-like [Littorina saxatilis]|uniref:cadherin-related family member 1-like n=1 Tax=Littorina saxatilis TaxID=31220 RepID=UPI0038B68C5F
MSKLTITVIDINDHSPQFSPSNSVTARIRENMGQGTALTFTTPLRISDLDEGVNSLFEVNITGNNAAHFEVVPSTVQSSADLVVRVTDGSVLDYEFRRSLSIMLLARETQTAEKRSSSVVITVQIEDENDNSPVFDKTSYEVTIQENEPARTFVTVVNATDDDGSMKFSRVTYSLQGAEGL